MRIRAYQTWLQEYDVARGWDTISPAHTFLHLIEEMGEIARHLKCYEGYRDVEDTDGLRAQLAEELADAATFLFKLAYLCEVDLEDALKGNMTKAETRFSVAYGQADTARYLARQVENLARMQRRHED